MLVLLSSVQWRLHTLSSLAKAQLLLAYRPGLNELTQAASSAKTLYWRRSRSAAYQVTLQQHSHKTLATWSGVQQLLQLTQAARHATGLIPDPPRSRIMLQKHRFQPSATLEGAQLLLMCLLLASILELPSAATDDACRQDHDKISGH